ncbi:MAG: Hsp20/alpha crystallin family protein [Nitrospinota bacterium]
MFTNVLVSDPFRDIFKEMESLDQELFPFAGGCRQRRALEFPAINVYEGTENLVLTAEVPGVEPDKIDVTVEGDKLTMRGTRTDEGAADASYYRRERAGGDFEKIVKLPFAVGTNDVKAVFKNGLLTVTLEKPEEQKPKKIAVKSI